MTPEQVENLNEQLRQTVQLVKSLCAHTPAAVKALEELAAAAMAAGVAHQYLADSQQ